MTALATINDVVDRLGRDLDTTEIDRMEAALTDTSAAVRSYTGQQFTPGDVTVRLRVRAGKVVLPQRPVLTVDEIVDMNGNDVSFEWFAGDRVDVPSNVIDSWSFEPYRSGLEWVDVSYTYGYDPIPDDIVSVVAQKVIRSIGTQPEFGGVTQMGLGDASVTYGTVGASGSAGFFDAERAVLDRYRRVFGTIRID